MPSKKYFDDMDKQIIAPLYARKPWDPLPGHPPHSYRTYERPQFSHYPERAAFCLHRQKPWQRMLCDKIDDISPEECSLLSVYEFTNMINKIIAFTECYRGAEYQFTLQNRIWHIQWAVNNSKLSRHCINVMLSRIRPLQSLCDRLPKFIPAARRPRAPQVYVPIISHKKRDHAAISNYSNFVKAHTIEPIAVEVPPVPVVAKVASQPMRRGRCSKRPRLS